MLQAINSIWDMLNEMSPYLLLGFFIAGVMHVFIPGQMFHRFLSGRRFRSVLNAALLGIPLPLCSCGVIPTAMSLRRDGASKGASVSFLVATPQTGIDSILASYSLLGLPFAIIRPIAALFTALFAGQMVNLTDNTEAEQQVNVHVAKSEKPQSIGKRFLAALHYAYVEMMGDIGKWLVMGIIIAGLIALIPNEYFALFKDNTFASIVLVLVLAIPMYLCATGSIPIAVALMLKGLTPGAALVMLMAGPASNMASIMVIGKVLGRRTLVTYLASIIGGSILFALLIDFVLPAEWFLPTMIMGADCCHEEPSLFAVICSVMLILMLINALLLHRHDECHCGDDHCDCHCDDDDCQVNETEHPQPNTHNRIKVKGMDCSHCASSVAHAIESVPGVESVKVDLHRGIATITGTADIDAVKKAVESIGFDCEE